MRTFIAIEFSSETRQKLKLFTEQLQIELCKQHVPPILRWTAVDNLHLTLRFLGDTTAQQTELIATSLCEVITHQQPLTFTIAGMGGFPNLQQPRVVWLGIDDASMRLRKLQAMIERIAQSAGFTAEERTFTAHLTLARAKRSATQADLRRAGEILRTEVLPAPIPVHVDAITHMRSDLQPEGPLYRPLGRFPLGYSVGNR